MAADTVTLSLLTLASRVLGMLRDIAIAQFFGAGNATDAFFVAFKIPNLLRRLFAEGSLTLAWIPVFSEELAASKERAHRAVNDTASFCLLFAGAAVVLGIVFADELVAFLAPGFQFEGSKHALALVLLKIMLPYAVMLSLLAVCAGAMNCLGNFWLPALSPILLNVAMILFALFGRAVFAPPVSALAWGVLAGGAAALAVQAAALHRRGFTPRWGAPWRSPAVRKLCRLFFPALAGATAYQVLQFLNTLLASMLPQGSISWLYYADRVFQFPLGVFTVSLATALLPRLAESSRAAAEPQSGASQLTLALSWVSFVTLPAAAGLFILAHPIIVLLFEHGNFSPESSIAAAGALRAYSIGLWPLSCEIILIRAFVGRRSAVLPALSAGVKLAVYFCAAAALMGPLGPGRAQEHGITWLVSALQTCLPAARLGHVGLALAPGFAAFAAVMLLAAKLPGAGLQVDFSLLARNFLKDVLAAAAMVLLLIILRRFVVGPAAYAALGVPFGAAIYLSAARLLRLPEASAIWRCRRYLKQQLRRTGD